MCEHKHHHEEHGHCCCEEPVEYTGCCCHGHHFETAHFQRLYKTREEQAQELEEYLNELKLEVQAVEELLEDLKK
jgi:hypothetical protein